MRLLFVAARLSAPTGVRPAALPGLSGPPSERGGVPLQGHVVAKHSPFRSGAASRADGSAARCPARPARPPVGTRRRSATGIRGGHAFAFCSGAASRADGSAARRPPRPPRPPQRNAEAFRYRNTWWPSIRLSVAARLPAPPPPLPRPPPCPAPPAPLGTRRRSATGIPGGHAFAFCSGAASRADGGAARSPARPPRNAEAFRYRIRGGGAFAFCSGAASRADGGWARCPPRPLRPPLGTRRRSATGIRGGGAFAFCSGAASRAAAAAPAPAALPPAPAPRPDILSNSVRGWPRTSRINTTIFESVQLGPGRRIASYTFPGNFPCTILLDSKSIWSSVSVCEIPFFPTPIAP